MIQPFNVKLIGSEQIPSTQTLKVNMCSGRGRRYSGPTSTWAKHRFTLFESTENYLQKQTAGQVLLPELSLPQISLENKAATIFYH